MQINEAGNVGSTWSSKRCAALHSVKHGNVAMDVCISARALTGVVGVCAIGGRSSKRESSSVEDMLCGKAALARRVAVAQ